MMTTVVDSPLIARLLKHPADKAAIIEGDIEWTYGGFAEKIRQLASALHAKGIQAGDRVALMLMNQKEFLLGFYALRYIGAVPVPINVQMPPEDIRYVIVHAGCKLVITNETFAPNFAGTPLPLLITGETRQSFEEALNAGNPEFESPYRHQPGGMHILMYTSGTTGKPKGVMLSEENLVSNIEGFADRLHLMPEDRALLALPLFHAYGLIIALYLLDEGGTVALVPNFSPKKIMETLVVRKITILPLVPTMFTVLLQGLERAGIGSLPDLRYCVSGGASLPAELLKRVEQALGVILLEGYGLTETSPVLCVNDPAVGSIPGSVGRPLNNVEIRLATGEEQTRLAGGSNDVETGEILVKGPNVMLGYYQMPEETRAVLTEDGYFKTGDLGHFDESGNLFISGGRKKDLIIKAGENISPLRVEEALYQHPAVQEASVIGVKDEKVGEEVMACVVMKPGMTVTSKELRTFCIERLGPLMAPAYFRFYEELPKNPAGKVLKKVLRMENPTKPQVPV